MYMTSEFRTLVFIISVFRTAFRICISESCKISQCLVVHHEYQIDILRPDNKRLFYLGRRLTSHRFKSIISQWEGKPLSFDIMRSRTSRKDAQLRIKLQPNNIGKSL